MLIIRLVVVSVLLTFLASCAEERTIGGADALKPEERVTLLEFQHQTGAAATISVVKFDGRWRGPGIFEHYALAPGMHDVTSGINIQQGNRMLLGTQTLSCYFAPGKTYSMQADILGSAWKVWIRDDAAGTKLSCRKV